MPSTFDLDLQDAIIGAIGLKGEIPPEIRPLLSPDLFTTQERKVQIAAQIEAFNTLGSTDPVTVQEILSRRGQPLDIILDIIKLAELVPSSAHLAAHVQLLREQNGVHDKGPATWTLLDVADLSSWKVEPLSWTVKPIIAQRRVGGLIGLPKVGKGIIALDLALHVAHKLPWLDRFLVTPCPILYLAREDHPERIKARIEEMQAGYGMDPLAKGQLVILSRERFALTNDDHLAWLSMQIKAHGVGLIILDVLGRMIPGLDGMNPRDWSVVMDRLETLNRNLGVTVLLVDHARKPPVGRGKAGGTSPLEMKGPIEKYGGMDFVMMVSETSQRGRLEILTEVKDSDERLHFLVDVSRECLWDGVGWTRKEGVAVAKPDPKLTWAGDVSALAEASSEKGTTNRQAVLDVFRPGDEMAPADVAALFEGKLARATIQRHLKALAETVPPKLLRRTEGQSTFYRKPSHETVSERDETLGAEELT